MMNQRKRIAPALRSIFTSGGYLTLNSYTANDSSIAIYLIENKTPFLLNLVCHSVVCDGFQISNDGSTIYYGYYNNYLNNGAVDTYNLVNSNAIINFSYMAY